jgi:2-isopropylmalate synthase
MKNILIADTTMRAEALREDYSLSFKEKLELARELSRLGVDVIEFAPLSGDRTDQLLVRTIASLVKNSILSCPTGLTEESLERAWGAVMNAAKPRLLVSVPVSPVQLEYICQTKPTLLPELVSRLVSAAAVHCGDVEFSAEDATGALLPDETAAFIDRLYERLPALKGIVLSIQCSDALSMAAACSFAAVGRGAGQIKTAAGDGGQLPLEALAGVVRARGDSLGIRTGLDMTGLSRSLGRMPWLRRGLPAFGGELSEIGEETVLDITTDSAALGQVLAKLGYELTDDDLARVYEAFRRIAVKKNVGVKELDAIVAGAALQVPATYKLVSYVINAGNVIDATAHIVLEKDGTQRRGLVTGDGPVYAAFQAVEQAAGRHFELDDFQIEAVTGGREAMGSALVKLRSGGRLFSGQGVSTDIVGASIRAYVDALNKIAYEENLQS